MDVAVGHTNLLFNARPTIVPVTSELVTVFSIAAARSVGLKESEDF